MNTTLSDILASLPADSLVQTASLGAPPADFASTGASGPWLSVTTIPISDDSAQAIKGQWESWLVEGAYADKAPSAGLPSLEGATYISGDPLSIESSHLEHVVHVDDASGAELDAIDNEASQNAEKLGLSSVKVGNETLDGAGIVVSGVSQDPAALLRDNPAPVNVVLSAVDQSRVDGVFLIVFDGSGNAVVGDAYVTQVGGEAKWVAPQYRDEACQIGCPAGGSGGTSTG